MAEFMSWRGRMGGRNAAPVVDHPGLGWWREARFGMFIHWGLYAIPAGIWKGEPVDGIGEWIMLRKRIPRAEYETLAKQFDPVRFDAAAWVDLAVQAGMRYLVITAKHHDGFALYQSPCCPYNIVDATPFGRDPLAELADACRAAGITLGFYYSQDQDWHDPGGSRNDWDFAAEDKDFAAYLERKVKPQLRELLTQYGPVGLIWFDTPYSISREHSIELRDFVHRLQPDCLVSGRIGNDVGDYGSLGDNQIPAGRVQADYETPATLNDTWGFKSTDHHWKSTETLLLLLIDLASKGVNYLLNVGPTAAGVIPEPSAQRLRAIGAWMRTNGEAIYGTGASPFPYEHDGLRMTAKPGRLFFHLLQPAAELVVHGLRSRVTGAQLLGSAAAVRYTQDRTAAGEVDRTTLSCLLRVKGYVAVRVGSAFRAAHSSRFLLHLFHPCPPVFPPGSAFAFTYILCLRSRSSIGAFIISPLPPCFQSRYRQQGRFPPPALPGFTGTTNPSATLSPVSRLPGAPGYTAYLAADFSPGRGGLLQLLSASSLPCRRYHPAGVP